MFYLLALLLAALWSWSLVTGNLLGGFIHVPLVGAVVCACFGRFRGRRVVARN